MKKTIKNVVLGGLSSLALVTGSSFADESKKEGALQGGIFADESKGKEVSKTSGIEDQIASQLEAQLKKAGMSDSQIEAIVKSAKEKAGVTGQQGKVITRTMVIGADGKLMNAKGKKDGGIDLGELLSEVEDGDIKKLLSEHKAAITSGKVVIIDADGNRTEKELEDGGNINDMLKQALNGLGKDADFKMEFGEVEKGVDYKKEINELKAELLAQRVLLKKILRKLD